MPVFAIVVFGFSLVAVASLFVVKHWEAGSGRELAPAFRARADVRAIELKRQLFNIRHDLARIPPIALLYCRYLIHEGALEFAAFARFAERQAHRLADTVSHKRTFVARAPRSEFLKKVSDRKSVDSEQQ